MHPYISKTAQFQHIIFSALSFQSEVATEPKTANVIKTGWHRALMTSYLHSLRYFAIMHKDLCSVRRFDFKPGTSSGTQTRVARLVQQQQQRQSEVGWSIEQGGACSADLCTTRCPSRPHQRRGQGGLLRRNPASDAEVDVVKAGWLHNPGFIINRLSYRRKDTKTSTENVRGKIIRIFLFFHTREVGGWEARKVTQLKSI